MLRFATSWALTITLVVGLLGFIADGVLLLRADLSVAIVMAGALIAASLAVPMAVVLALFATVAMLVARKLQRPSLEPLFGGIVGGALAWWLLDPMRRRAMYVYVAMTIVTALGFALSVWLRRAQPPRLARASLAMITLAALAADVYWSPTVYLELHNVCYAVAILAILFATVPIARFIQKWRRSRLMAIALISVAISTTVLLTVDQAAPGWRAVSERVALHGPRLGRGLRNVIDLDRDGFSPVFWGGDCDDFDASRHPNARDPAGDGDSNCNGADPTAAPPAAAFGLTPAFGTPHLEADLVDLMLLVTVDTLRADAVIPGLSPRLAGLAKQGAVFSRAYTSAPSTKLALPLLHRADETAANVADQLRTHGIESAAIIAAGFAADNVGFTDHVMIGNDAARVTTAALQRIRQARGKRLFLWVHYFDPHSGPPVSQSPPAARPDWPARYRIAVRYVDREVGRLLDSLHAEDRWKRTAMILTSDHGEFFGEHGVTSHGRSGYDPGLRVPAIFLAPGIVPGRYEQLVSHRDIPATILGAFGLTKATLAAERFGRSWLRLRQTPAAPLHDFVVSRSARFVSGREVDIPLAILVTDRHKLIASMHDGLREVFDLQTDPDEVHDLFSSHLPLASRLWKKLALYCDLDGYPANFRAP